MEAVKLEVHQNHNMVCPIEVRVLTLIHTTQTLHRIKKFKNGLSKCLPFVTFHNNKDN